MEEKKKLADLENAGRILGVNRITLWRYRKIGLPSIVVGRQVYFRRSDLLRWKNQKVKRGDCRGWKK